MNAGDTTALREGVASLELQANVFFLLIVSIETYLYKDDRHGKCLLPGVAHALTRVQMAVLPVVQEGLRLCDEGLAVSGFLRTWAMILSVSSKHRFFGSGPV